MRFALIAAVVFACGVAVAGEEASVLVSPTPADAQAAAPAAAVAAPCCENGTCSAVRSRTRFRTVTEGCDACTGQSVRSVTRGVVRGTGEVVHAAGTAAVNVVKAPVRVFRGRRVCCCN